MNCLQCGREIQSKTAKKFCCSSCAATYNNIHRLIKTGGTKKLICNDCGKEFEGSCRLSPKTCICSDCARIRREIRISNKAKYTYDIKSEPKSLMNKRASYQQVLPSNFSIPLNSKQKGNLTELLCMAAFYSRGYNVCTPFGENSRYDFIADIDGKLIRVQVKTARCLGNGSYAFSCKSTHACNQHKVKVQKYTKEEIDYFCTIIDNEFCLVPVEECSGEKIIRTILPENNQITHMNWIDDYKLDKMINDIKNI